MGKTHPTLFLETIIKVQKLIDEIFPTTNQVDVSEALMDTPKIIAKQV